MGEILVEQGRITTAQLDEALTIQQQHPESRRRLGIILYSLGYVTLKDVVDALKVQHRQRSSDGRTRPSILLGELLVEAGLVTRAQVETALSVQGRTGRKLGEILCDLGFITPDRLIEALLAQLGIDFLHD
ncbi:MAG: hypothetical protein HY814_04260 [Candidatus Riflebacteria bacterium]|nr:hypothetical protein [Candidatus Riflebacteria bacterium]